MGQLLLEFKAFLVKTNALAVAVGITLGLAVVALVNGVIACFITPLIDKVLPGNLGGGFSIWVFRVGDFVSVAINFVVIALVLFAIGKMFMKEEKKA